MICQESSNSIFNLAPQFLAAHDTMRFLSGLLFLVIPLQEVSSQQTVRVNKCCPMGQIFKSSEKSCVQSSGIRLILAESFPSSPRLGCSGKKILLAAMVVRNKSQPR